jgi:phage tail protein X
MTVQAGSRYHDSPILILSVNDIHRQVIGIGPQEPYAFIFQSYQVTGTDRLDTLAFDFYGDETKWYAIADANPEVLDWTNMPVGTIIRIPNLI